MTTAAITKLAVHHDWRLIDLSTKETLYYGQRVVTFRGELGTLEWATPPKHDGSTGRVYFRPDRAGYQHEFFPSVINAAWVNGDDLP